MKTLPKLFLLAAFILAGSASAFAQPDLVVSRLEGPTSAEAGESLSYWLYFENIGDQSASGTFEVRVALTDYPAAGNGPGASIGAGAEQTKPHTTGLGAGGTASFSFDITVPSGTAPGTYIIEGYVDSGLAINESDEDNNHFRVNFTVTDPGQPDLLVSDFFGSDSEINDGEHISYYVNIRNDGDDDVNGSFSVRLYITMSDLASAVVVQEKIVSGIPADSSEYISFDVDIPCNTPAGIYDVVAEADSGNIVAESNEDNNMDTLSLTVQARDRPDLTIYGFDGLDKTYKLGDKIETTLYIKNSSKYADATGVYYDVRFQGYDSYGNFVDLAVASGGPMTIPNVNLLGTHIKSIEINYSIPNEGYLHNSGISNYWFDVTASYADECNDSLPDEHFESKLFAVNVLADPRINNITYTAGSYIGGDVILVTVEMQNGSVSGGEPGRYGGGTWGEKDLEDDIVRQSRPLGPRMTDEYRLELVLSADPKFGTADAENGFKTDSSRPGDDFLLYFGDFLGDIAPMQVAVDGAGNATSIYSKIRGVRKIATTDGGVLYPDVDNYWDIGETLLVDIEVMIPGNYKGIYFVAGLVNALYKVPEQEAENRLMNNIYVAEATPQIEILPTNFPLTSRLSQRADEEGNLLLESGDYSDYPSISADGEMVAFASYAANLVGELFEDINGNGEYDSGEPFTDANGNGRFDGDTNQQRDIFVYSRSTGGIKRASVSADSEQANAQSFNPAISADGRFVAFESTASNLVENDIGGSSDIFVKELQTNTIVRVSVNASGEQGNADSFAPAISEDGRFIAFESNATNLDPYFDEAEYPIGSLQVFVHDRDTDDDGIYDEKDQTATWLASVTDNGVIGNHISYSPALSLDGRTLVFVSRAGNFPDAQQHTMVYLRPLSAGRPAGFMETVSVSTAGTPADGQSFEPSVNGDGTHIAFTSYAGNLTAADANGVPDVFVRDRNKSETLRISVSTTGLEALDPETAGGVPSGSLQPSIDRSGRYIAFRSLATNLEWVERERVKYLAPADVFDPYRPLINSPSDVFVYDRDWDKDGVFDETGTLPSNSWVRTRKISVDRFGYPTYLLLGIPSSGSSRVPAISADGRYIAFASDSENTAGLVFDRTNRLPQDENFFRDIFMHDRRITVEEPDPGNQPPEISIIEPEAGATVTVNSTQIVRTEVSDADGSVVQVEFFLNGNPLPSPADTEAPFSAVFSPENLYPGADPDRNVLIAVATDNEGAQTSSAMVYVMAREEADGAPVINNFYEISGDTTPIINTPLEFVVETDNPGDISRVNLYENGALADRDFIADPNGDYTFTRVPPSVGVYEYYVVAVDNAGNQTTSLLAYNITVQAGTPPVVELTSPPAGEALAEGVAYAAGDRVISANRIYEVTTAGTIPQDAIAEHGGFLVETDPDTEEFIEDAGFTYVREILAGQPLAEMTAYTEGDRVISNGRLYEVTTPGVIDEGKLTQGLVSTDGFEEFIDEAGFKFISYLYILDEYVVDDTVNITAAASDADGSVASVRFHQNGALIASDTASPYQAAFTPALPDNYYFHAEAYDNLGNVTATFPVMATVFTDPPEITRFDNDAGENPMVQVPINFYVDVFSKGEIVSVELYQKEPGQEEAGLEPAGTDYSEPFRFTVTPSTVGTYEFWVVATDNLGQKTDSRDDPGLITVVTVTPSLAVITPLGMADDPPRFAKDRPLTLVAAANVNNPTISGVRFYANGELLGDGAFPKNESGTTFPQYGRYELEWMPDTVGTYEITAVQVNLNGDEVFTSDPQYVQITPFRGSLPPYTQMVNPNIGDSFTDYSTIRITASALDPDGAVTQVQFHVNGEPEGNPVIRQASLFPEGYPYSIDWTPPDTGVYTITAVATDTSGNQVMSAPVTVNATTGAGVPPSVGMISPAATGQVADINIVAEGVGATAVATIDENTQISDVAVIDGGSGYTTSPEVQIYGDGCCAFVSARINPDLNGTVTEILIPEPGTTGWYWTFAYVLLIGGFGYDETIYLEADAFDMDGRITQVEFFINGSSASTGVDYFPPYGAEWRPENAGFYQIEARATDDHGNKVSAFANINVGPVLGAPPAVSIENPQMTLEDPLDPDSAKIAPQITMNSNVNFVVEANDGDGTVEQVELFANGLSMGLAELDEATGNYLLEYSFGLDGRGPGSYNVVAQAMDNDGHLVSSKVLPVDVIQGGARPPEIELVPFKEKFTDDNGNGVWDEGEPYVDADADGRYDNGKLTSGSDILVQARPFQGETFTDDNGNGVWDAGEAWEDANGNGEYDPPETQPLAWVEFYVNGEPVTPASMDYFAPFAVFWRPSTTGLYRILAKAANAKGDTNFVYEDVTVHETVGTPPSVVLSLTREGSITPQSSVLATATVYDDNPLDVTFFLNGEPVESVNNPDTSEPYSMVLRPVSNPFSPVNACGLQLSTYEVIAVVTDADGNSRAASTSDIFMGDLTKSLPETRIVDPESGEDLLVGSVTQVRAEVTGTGSRDVLEVIFYVNGIEEHVDKTKPYTYDWMPPETGTYEIRVASVRQGYLFDHDKDRNCGVDEPTPDIAAYPVQVSDPLIVTASQFVPNPPVISVKVLPPAESYVMGSTVMLFATAYDPDDGDYVTEVEFFLNDGLNVEKLATFEGDGTKNYFLLPWKPIRAGDFTVFATARDMTNNVAQSGTALSSITVLNEVYTPPSVDLTHPISNVGEAYDDANGNGEYDEGETFTDANANGQYDAPYQSGTPIDCRSNYSGFISQVTYVDYYADGIQIDLDNELISEDDNEPAILEIRPFDFSWTPFFSSDVPSLVLFSAVASELDSGGTLAAVSNTREITVIKDEPPSSITIDLDPAEGFLVNNEITFTVTAADNGAIKDYKLKINGAGQTPADAETAPNVFTFTPSSPGEYSYTAEVRDISDLSLTSAPQTISVTMGDPPEISITKPQDGAGPFQAGEDLTVKFTASDPDGKIVKAELLENGFVVSTVEEKETKEGEDAQPMQWNEITYKPATAGQSISLTVRVTDNSGNRTTSEPVSITVIDGPVPKLPVLKHDAGTGYVLVDDIIHFTVEIPEGEGDIAKVELMTIIFGQPGRTFGRENPPYEYDVYPMIPMVSVFYAVVTNTEGNQAVSEPVTIYVLEPQPVDNDMDFINQTFLDLLARGPDNAELTEYISRFIDGDLDREDLLHVIMNPRAGEESDVSKEYAKYSRSIYVAHYVLTGSWPARKTFYDNVRAVWDRDLSHLIQEDLIGVFQEKYYGGKPLPGKQATTQELENFFNVIFELKYGEPPTAEQLKNGVKNIEFFGGVDEFLPVFLSDNELVVAGDDTYTQKLFLKNPPNNRMKHWADAAILLINFLGLDPAIEEVTALAAKLWDTQVDEVYNNPRYAERFPEPVEAIGMPPFGLKHSFLGWVDDSNYPWIYHWEHGYLYHSPFGIPETILDRRAEEEKWTEDERAKESPEGAFLYDMEISWLFANSDYYDADTPGKRWMYSFDRNKWLFFFGILDSNERGFWEFGAGANGGMSHEWFTAPKSGAAAAQD